MLDTQATTPWVGVSSPAASGIAPSMVLHEVFELNGSEVGVVLFSGEFQLSTGLTRFKEFLLTDFLEPDFEVMGPPRHEGMLATIKQVRRMVMEMISAMSLASSVMPVYVLSIMLLVWSLLSLPIELHGLDLRNEVQLYLEDLPKLQATAQQAAANIIAAQDREEDESKKQKKIEKTKAWLQLEMDALEGKRLCLEGMKERRMTAAGKKVQALILFLRKHHWLSDWLHTHLDAWDALDTVEAAAKKVARKAPPAADNPLMANTEQSDRDPHGPTSKHAHEVLAVSAAAAAVQETAPANQGTHGAHQHPGPDAAAAADGTSTETIAKGATAVLQSAPANHCTHGGHQHPGPDAPAADVDSTSHKGHLETIAEGAAAVPQSAPANHATHGGHQHPVTDAPAAADIDSTIRKGHLATIAEGAAAVPQSAPANHATHGGHQSMATDLQQAAEDTHLADKQEVDTSVCLTPHVHKANPAHGERCPNAGDLVLLQRPIELEPRKEPQQDAPVQNLDEAFAKVADAALGANSSTGVGPPAAAEAAEVTNHTGQQQTIAEGATAVLQPAPANHHTHGGHQHCGPDAAAAAANATSHKSHLVRIAEGAAAAVQSAPANHGTHGGHQHSGPDAAAADIDSSSHTGHFETIAEGAAAVPQSAPANHATHGGHQHSGPDAAAADIDSSSHTGHFETIAEGAAAVPQSAPANHATHGGHQHPVTDAPAADVDSAAAKQSAPANHGTQGEHHHVGPAADAPGKQLAAQSSIPAGHTIRLQATPQKSMVRKHQEANLGCHEEATLPATQLVSTSTDDQCMEDTLRDEGDWPHDWHSGKESQWQWQPWTEDRQPDPLQHSLELDGEDLDDSDELEDDDLLIEKLEARKAKHTCQHAQVATGEVSQQLLQCAAGLLPRRKRCVAAAS